MSAKPIDPSRRVAKPLGPSHVPGREGEESNFMSLISEVVGGHLVSTGIRLKGTDPTCGEMIFKETAQLRGLQIPDDHFCSEIGQKHRPDFLAFKFGERLENI